MMGTNKQHTHFRKVCKQCGVTIEQCRCMSGDKRTDYTVCQDCINESLQKLKVKNAITKNFNVLIEIGSYVLSFNKHGDLWLLNKDGEGMEVSLINLEKVLDRFFKENF